MNSGTRSSAINILFILTLAFYCAAVALACFHIAEPIVDRAWGAFEGVIGALLLILKADNDNHKSDAPPPLARPVDPPQPK
jgi:hypothetical protein